LAICFGISVENRTTSFPVDPDFAVHVKLRIIMAKKSGLKSIAIWPDKLGIELTEDEAIAVFKEVKRKSHDLKRVFTEDDLKDIIRIGKE
jgi:isopropylmalate/homocitrate/citramalate synthase